MKRCAPNTALRSAGSAMQAMGASDVRASAPTIAAFLAAQDVYKSSPSLSREIAGVLTQSWWVKWHTGNVVSVALGTSTEQYVKLADGTYKVLGAGSPSTLAWAGSRAPFEEKCPNTNSPEPWAVTRGWDYSNVSFAIADAGGDVQNFGFWQSYYFDNVGYCGNMKGFRLNTWTFPQGPSITLTYRAPDGISTFGDSGPQIAEITNSLGRKLRYNYSSGDLWAVLSSIDDGLSPSR